MRSLRSVTTIGTDCNDTNEVDRSGVKRSADTMGCMHKVNGERQGESTAATRLWTTGPSLHTGLLEISVAANNMGEDWTEIPCVPRRHQNVITRQRVRSSLAVIRGLAVSALIIIACRNVEAPRQPGPCLGVIHAPHPSLQRAVPVQSTEVSTTESTWHLRGEPSPWNPTRIVSYPHRLASTLRGRMSTG